MAEEEQSSGGWLWLGIIILVVIFCLVRLGPKSYPWNEPGYQPGPGDSGMGYSPGSYGSAAQQQYPAGSYGAFWENEERAAQGVPGAVPSPGILPSQETIRYGQARAEKQRAEAEANDAREHEANLRQELDQLKQELEQIRQERRREKLGY